MSIIRIYTNTAENNRIDKSSYLTLITAYNHCTFKDSISIINPIVRIRPDSHPVQLELIKGNYAYIEDFDRYYYIDDIVCVSDLLIEYYLSCDVLMSFKEDILNLDVYVSRQEFNVNEYLPDEKMPSNIEPIIEEDIIEPVIEDVKIQNPYSFNNTIRCVSLNVVNDQSNEEHYSNNCGYTSTYLFNLSDLREFNNFVMNGDAITNIGLLFQNPSEGVISLNLFPFDLFEIFNHASAYFHSAVIDDVINVKVGSVPFVCHTKLLRDFTTPELIIAHSVYIKPKYNNFLDYYPYTKIQLFLPLYGYVDLPTNLVMGKTINIKLYPDIISGRAIYTININDVTILTFNANTSFSIPLTTSNHSENLRNILLGGIAVIGGTISGNIGVMSAGASLMLPTRKTGPGRQAKIRSDYARSVDRVTEQKQEALTLNSITNFTIDVAKGNQHKFTVGTFSPDYCILSMGTKIKVLYDRPNPVYFFSEDVINYVNKYRHLVGSPSSYNGVLSNLSGYTEVSGVHIENINNATTSELDEIDSTLRDGVIV